MPVTFTFKTIGTLRPLPPLTEKGEALLALLSDSDAYLKALRTDPVRVVTMASVTEEEFTQVALRLRLSLDDDQFARVIQIQKQVLEMMQMAQAIRAKNKDTSDNKSQ